ncbi:YraN family protein, partial [Candidatus Parcubacteria bacterium]|nr:YraN family protein [Candidatus Parcubacteria bacterium]
MKLDNRTEKRKLGDIGENIACDFLKNRGYTIVERNYLRKWGEIDIVARKGEVIHFVEVKSVSGVSHGTS